MADPIDRLIDNMSRDVAPVRRLRPPLVRATLWLAVVALVGGAVIVVWGDLHIVAARTRQPAFDVALVSALVTGCLAVTAAFYLSLPDRPLAWALLPMPALAVWLASSGIGCYRDWLTDRSGAWRLGESGDCFMFILAIGIPLSLALLVTLRRARPIFPRRVAILGALGAASLAAFLLQFFHPFAITLMDLLVHATGCAVLITLISWRPVRVLLQ